MQTLMFMKSLRTWDWEKSKSESEKHSNEQSQRNDEQPPVHNKRASHFFQKCESKSDDNSEIKKNSAESDSVEIKKKQLTRLWINVSHSLSLALSLSLHRRRVKWEVSIYTIKSSIGQKEKLRCRQMRD